MSDGKKDTRPFAARVLRHPITGTIASAGIIGGTLWTFSASNQRSGPSLPPPSPPITSPNVPPPMPTEALGTTIGNMGDHLLYRERGHQSSPINQQAINQLYAKIYDALKSGKERAEAGKKQLAILIGEKHDSYDSLLIELMVLDVARRLGIKTLGLETFAGEIAEYKQQLPALLSRVNERKRSLVATLAKPEEELSEAERSAMELYIYPNIFNAIDNENRQLFGYGLANRTTLAFRMMPEGFDIQSFDPFFIERGKAITQTNQTINTAFEDEMIAAMKKQPSHFIGIFGGLHVPYLKDSLPADKFETIVIDATNLELSGVTPQTKSDRMEAMRKEQLAERRDIDGFIDGAPPANIAETFARAHVASLTHQNIRVELPLKGGTLMVIPSGQEFAPKPIDRGGP